MDHLLPLAKKERVVRLIPTEDEFRAMVATIRNPVQEPQLGRQVANCQAEASALRWSDIDEKRNEILYTRQKTRNPFKTPIYGWLKPLILRLKASGKEGGDTKVFAIREVKHAMATACRTLGYPHFTHRSLRAMRIKRLWEAGVDVKVIAEWQGHSDGGKLILDTYTEVFGSNDSGYRQAQLKKAEAAMQATSASEASQSLL